MSYPAGKIPIVQTLPRVIRTSFKTSVLYFARRRCYGIVLRRVDGYLSFSRTSFAC